MERDGSLEGHGRIELVRRPSERRDLRVNLSRLFDGDLGDPVGQLLFDILADAEDPVGEIERHEFLLLAGIMVGGNGVGVPAEFLLHLPGHCRFDTQEGRWPLLDVCVPSWHETGLLENGVYLSGQIRFPGQRGGSGTDELPSPPLELLRINPVPLQHFHEKKGHEIVVVQKPGGDLERNLLFLEVCEGSNAVLGVHCKEAPVKKRKAGNGPQRDRPLHKTVPLQRHRREVVRVHQGDLRLAIRHQQETIAEGRSRDVIVEPHVPVGIERLQVPEQPRADNGESALTDPGRRDSQRLAAFCRRRGRRFSFRQRP